MRTDIIQTRGYNPNIAGDDLSLKIASYPATARHLAKRLENQGKTVCELCCGIGISLIELSKSFDEVIGIDNDPSIVDDCRKNLESATITNQRTRGISNGVRSGSTSTLAAFSRCLCYKGCCYMQLPCRCYLLIKRGVSLVGSA